MAEARGGQRGAVWTALVVGLMLIGGPGTARADTSWDISLWGGVEDVGSRDEMGSPLAYRGRGFPLMLRSGLDWGRWSGGMEVGGFFYGVNGGNLQAELSDGVSHRADSVFVDLSLWAQRVVATPEHHRLSLGLQISHWTFYRSYLYAPNQIGSVETWDAPLTADLRAQVERTIGDRLQVRVAAAIPLVGRMMRSNYSMRGDERIALIDERHRLLTQGRWVSLNRFQMLRGQAALYWRVSERWSLAAQYRIGMFTYRDDTLTQAMSQRGLAGLRFVFW